MREEHSGYFETVWPRTERRAVVKSLARRPGTLAGKRVAFVWDYLFRGDEIFDLLAEGLKTRYPGVEFVSWREFGNTHGKNERDVLAAIPAKLKELRVDAVISGMGC